MQCLILDGHCSNLKFVRFLQVIQIEDDDDLPKFVCSDCEITLSHFLEFCEMVKKVQKNLKTQILALTREPNVSL